MLREGLNPDLPGAYLQRAFIFPLLIRGKGRMPLGIVVMGMVFNTLNALMQGGWIFYVSPADYYAGWFAQPYISREWP